MHVLQQKDNPQAEMTTLALYNKFIDRIRNNLHLVLAFSPIGDAFRNRLRMFPSLINCCTIDWFQVIVSDLWQGSSLFSNQSSLAKQRFDWEGGEEMKTLWFLYCLVIWREMMMKTGYCTVWRLENRTSLVWGLGWLRLLCWGHAGEGQEWDNVIAQSHGW